MASSRWQASPKAIPTGLRPRPPRSGSPEVTQSPTISKCGGRLPAVDQRADPDIARDAVGALKAELPISHDRIKVIVKDGWVTLEGAVEWQYQKTTAENAVRKVKGVKGVTNVITVKPKVQPSELQRKILEAFKRNAEVDANRITVEANGSEVILKGTVRSWIEREEAERVAWSAPGVTRVEDGIVVSP